MVYQQVLAAMVYASRIFSVEFEPVARAVFDVVSAEPPVFEGENATEKTAALVISIGKYESDFRVHVLGDHGKSKGLFQIQTDHEWTDPRATTREAIRLIRVSFTLCKALPMVERLAAYAAGSCDSERGRALSRHRFALAKWILPTLLKEPENVQNP